MNSNIAIIAYLSVVITAYANAECPTQCPYDLIKPTCGSDGHLYYSECHMEKNTCGTGVTKVNWADCKADCSSGACTMEYMPRCGNDGIKYGNKCTLMWAGCGKSVPVHEVPMEDCKPN